MAHDEHWWVPIGLQPVPDPDYVPPTPSRPGIRLDDFPVFLPCIVHACACGEWRLIEMPLDAEYVRARLVRPPR